MVKNRRRRMEMSINRWGRIGRRGKEEKNMMNGKQEKLTQGKSVERGGQEGRGG
jgi:hypothetical protein